MLQECRARRFLEICLLHLTTNSHSPCGCGGSAGEARLSSLSRPGLLSARDARYVGPRRPCLGAALCPAQHQQRQPQFRPMAEFKLMRTAVVTLTLPSATAPFRRAAVAVTAWSPAPSRPSPVAELACPEGLAPCPVRRCRRPKEMPPSGPSQPHTAWWSVSSTSSSTRRLFDYKSLHVSGRNTSGYERDANEYTTADRHLKRKALSTLKCLFSGDIRKFAWTIAHITTAEPTVKQRILTGQRGTPPFAPSRWGSVEPNETQQTFSGRHGNDGRGHPVAPFRAIRAGPAVLPTESCCLPLMTTAGPEMADCKESTTLNDTQTNVLVLLVNRFKATRRQTRRSLPPCTRPRPTSWHCS